MAHSSTGELDEVDREIVALLQQNGRLSNAALAEAVGLTQTPMLQRVRKLERTGVITGYRAVVDPAKLGRSIVAFVHVTLKAHGSAIHQKFLDLISTVDNVLECHHIAGDEDFLLKVVVRDVLDLERFLLHELSASGVVGRVKTTFVLSSAKVSTSIVPAEREGGVRV